MAVAETEPSAARLAKNGSPTARLASIILPAVSDCKKMTCPTPVQDDVHSNDDDDGSWGGGGVVVAGWSESGFPTELKKRQDRNVLAFWNLGIR
jgi:hypothetical protein